MPYVRTGRSGQNIIQGCQSTTTWTTNYYVNLNGESTAQSSMANAMGIMPMTGTFRNLYVELQTAPGTDKTVTVTLYVNGVASDLTVSIAGASATTGHDTAHTATGVAGDDVCYKLTRTSTTADGALYYGIEFMAG